MRCAKPQARTRRQRRRAIALIEVLVALSLLGGLVAGAVVARGRLVRGLAQDSARARAVEVADRLLHGWWEQSAQAWRPGVPRAGRGTVPGPVPLRWQTQTRPQLLDANGLHDRPASRGGAARLDRVRLSLWGEGPEPVYRVELLLPARPVSPAGASR